jgi:hypothetical protein
MASDERGEVARRDGQRTFRSRTADEERRRVRALTDAGVIAAMREGDTWAWGEFGMRFEPLLLAYARRIGIPADARRERVLDLLADEGMRLAEARGAVPAQLASYLAKALRHRYLNEKRSWARRATAYSAAAMESDHNGARGQARAEPGSPNGKTSEASVRERRIEHVCSEGALRDSLGPAVHQGATSRVVEGLAAFIRMHLTDEEQQILAWEERRMPHRQIAEWLGVSYDAATKRVWRLKRRAQTLAAHYAQVLPPEDRRELERLFRRAGVNGAGNEMTRRVETAKLEEAEP